MSFLLISKHYVDLYSVCSFTHSPVLEHQILSPVGLEKGCNKEKVGSMRMDLVLPHFVDLPFFIYHPGGL